MKKLILGVSCAAAIGLGLFSCSKEENLTTKNESTSIQDPAKIPPIVIVRCTPHRNKYNCEDGWGLCDCQWFPDAPWQEQITTNVISETTMRLSSPSFVDNGENILYVDNNLALPKEVAEKNNCKEIVILKGEYFKQNDQSVIVNIQLTK